MRDDYTLRRLIIRPGAIGDSILALPAMEHLKAPHTEVWVRFEMVPLIRFADSVRTIASTGLDLLGIEGIDPPPRLLERLAGFDSIVSWYGTNRDTFRHCLTNAQFLPALPDASNREHCADFFANQVGAPLPAIPRIAYPPSTPADFIVIHPFSGSPKKNWPLDRYQELARRLPLPVRWCAGPEEQLPNAVRYENLYDLGYWLRFARLYIGNDSGITHLAAAAGAPVVAIFGPTDPAIWAPRAHPVRVLSGPLESISVEDVLHAVHEILA
jgi:ADP-heptose:LPS heptosyltransferase